MTSIDPALSSNSTVPPSNGPLGWAKTLWKVNYEGLGKPRAQ
jgi:hypothetical protein